MIGPEMAPQAHPRSLLKRKQPDVDVCNVVTEVCNYETITDYIQLYSPGAASLESGYQTGAPDPDDEDSNLSWLLNFKVSSLFDPAAEERPQPPPPPPRRDDTCQCAVGGQRVQSGKPPFTYTELIEKALREQGELTVSGIYSWISANYSYYSPNDDRWKNSVRHNLSINPHFRKGLKSRHGAGHLWTLSDEGVQPPPESWKRCRIVGRSPPATPATAPVAVQVLDEAAVAAATLMQLDADPDEPEPVDTLHRTAEEILSGVKRRVEVQYLVHDQNTSVLGASVKNEPDHTIILTVPTYVSWSTLLHPHPYPHPCKQEFLNPVSKEEVVSESGLDAGTGECSPTSASSLLSELNAELLMSDNDHLFSDELAFTCYSQL